jgi:hypothetical protein
MPATEYRVISGPVQVMNQQLPAQWSTGWKPIMMSTAEVNGHLVVTILLEHPPAAPAAQG